MRAARRSPQADTTRRFTTAARPALAVLLLLLAVSGSRLATASMLPPSPAKTAPMRRPDLSVAAVEQCGSVALGALPAPLGAISLTDLSLFLASATPEGAVAEYTHWGAQKTESVDAEAMPRGECDSDTEPKGFTLARSLELVGGGYWEVPVPVIG